MISLYHPDGAHAEPDRDDPSRRFGIADGLEREDSLPRAAVSDSTATARSRSRRANRVARRARAGIGVRVAKAGRANLNGGLAPASGVGNGASVRSGHHVMSTATTVFGTAARGIFLRPPAAARDAQSFTR